MTGFQKQVFPLTELIKQDNPDKLRRYLLRINKEINNIFSDDTINRRF